jgi:hypothetical protein
MLLGSESRRGARNQCYKSSIRTVLTADTNINIDWILIVGSSVASEGQHVAARWQTDAEVSRGHEASMPARRHPLNDACWRSLSMVKSQHIRQLICLHGFLHAS